MAIVSIHLCQASMLALGTFGCVLPLSAILVRLARLAI